MSRQSVITDLCGQVGFEIPDQYNASRLLWNNLEGNEDRVALICDESTWTYADLAIEAAKIGNFLLASDVKPGDRVMLFMDDEPAYVAAVMGCLRAGLVPVLSNTLSTEDLVKFYLQDSEASAAIVSRPHAGLFTPDKISATPCRHIFITDNIQPWDQANDSLDEAQTCRTDMAFWMYSSGSTGRPKGIVHKQEDAAYTAYTYASRILDLKPDDVCFSVPKIFFAYGFGNSVTFPMAAGASAVLMANRPGAENIFAQIARHKPTVFFGLPTLYTALSRHEAADSANLESIRLCVSAAEILSEEIALSWQKRFGLAIVEGLGSTEMLHIYLSNSAESRKTGSAGQVVPGYAIKLTDENGEEADNNQEGVMSVCGLSGAEYYWQRPDKTAESMKGEWLVTGDRFIRDDDGFYFFKGRIDDLVKVSGQWLYPMEIEVALNEHSAVVESCVAAIDLADQRKTVKAWVVCDSSQSDREVIKQLKQHCQSTLLPHKYPREIILLDNLPKTGTGKIDRQALLDTV